MSDPAYQPSPPLPNPLPLAGEGANAPSKPIDRRGDERDAQGDRLSWRCRRGLLELDLWLGGFLRSRRATLQPDDLAAFERLLALSDMQIMDYLHGRVQTDDSSVRALVGHIQNYRDSGDEQNGHPQL